MTDIVTTARRSEMMAHIRAKDTTPELRVRVLLHAAGYRYRLHVRNLPGTPDIVLARYRTVVRVQGCYWHRHAGCRLAYTPKSRVEFWTAKFAGNCERDERQRESLEADGWRVVDVWECETRDASLLARALSERMPPRMAPPWPTNKDRS